MVAEVNVEPSQLTHYVDIFLEGPAGQILPALVARLAARRS
jgi:NAD-dependent SIR2 family protein deacetylase